MNITFHGAARTVTGSRHLIELNNGKRLLLDGGLFQGHDPEEVDHLNRHLGFNPATIDYIILSHAHMDHSGNLPRLIKEGFNGRIFATPPTVQLCKIMLTDSAFIQKVDTRELNKSRRDKGQDEMKPLYHKGDVQETIQAMQAVEYDEFFRIDKYFAFRFHEAGHVLGSAMVELFVNEDENTKTICYTGDVGRPKNRLLNPPAKIPDADYLICESTYGDRLHEPMEEAEKAVKKAVIDTCKKKKGKLLIPAFSLGRSQEVVYALENMFRNNELPYFDIFVDSPLALNATDITLRSKRFLNKEFREYLSEHSDAMEMEKVHYVRSKDESKAVNFYSGPCIIVSASGMMEGGRILHHAKNLIADKLNTFLFVGFATPESLGGKLQAGEKEVEILGKTYQVNAEIRKTDNFSAHADYQELAGFLEEVDKDRLRSLFLVHGEGDSQKNFSNYLVKNGFQSVQIPEKGLKTELQ